MLSISSSRLAGEAQNTEISYLNSKLQTAWGINDELAKLALKATGYDDSFRGEHFRELAREAEEHYAAESISTSMTKAQISLPMKFLAGLHRILRFACEIVAADE